MTDNQRITEGQRTFSKSLGAFSSATLLSRILGYIRDALVAAYFGGGLLTDAFYAAFKIPNLLRRFLGEGSLTAAFIPVFGDVLNKKGKEEANHFFHSLQTALFMVLTVLVGLGIVFAPQVARIVAWGFIRDPEKFQLTVELIRLTFPFLFIISFAALISAALNASGRFFIPALAPAGLSVGEIAFIVFFAAKMDSPVHGLAISAVVGVGLHFLWQLPTLYKEGYSLKWSNPFGNTDVKRVFWLMGPTILGLSADQINSFVDQLCASFLRDGSITALYNSNRVMQLPLALFGIAVASVSLPALSRHASQNNEKEFKETLNFSLRVANFVLIPAFIGLAVLGFPIVQALFQHGRFTEAQAWLTYQTLVPYALGLPAYSAIKILASAFYARKNTKTPAKIAMAIVALNTILCIVLMQYLEAPGLALAAAISSWAQTGILFIYLRRSVGLLGGRAIFKSFLWGILAGGLMGVICYLFAFVWLAGFSVYIRVFVPLIIGVLVYFSLAKLLKIEECNFFLRSLLRR